MAEDVDDDSTVVFFPVVPGGGLQLFEFSGEHPVTELSPDREDFSEEAGVDEVTKFEQTRQPQLVLHHAVFSARQQ